MLVGAYYRGGRKLARTLEFLDRLDVLPLDAADADEAGRPGAESLRHGVPLVGNDLLVAATARVHRESLVRRDSVFSMVPGLAVEPYQP